MVFKAITWFRESLVKPFTFLQVLCSGHHRMFLAIVCLQNHIGEKQWLYVFSNVRDHNQESLVTFALVPLQNEVLDFHNSIIIQLVPTKSTGTYLS